MSLTPGFSLGAAAHPVIQRFEELLDGGVMHEVLCVVSSGGFSH